MSSNQGGKTIRSVDRTLNILEKIGERNTVGVTELAEELNVSKSTIHNHLNTMTNRGYVVNENDQYRLGLQFLWFSDVIQKSNRLYQMAVDEVDELVDGTGERSQVLVEENGHGTYIYQQTDDRAIRTSSRVGTRVSLHSSAIGKALLAYQPSEKVDRILDRDGLPAMTEYTITSREAFVDELERVRETGVAFDDEEGIEGMRCVAAPIKNDQGISVGAISISGPCTRIQGERFEKTLPQEVQRAAQAIEINYRFA
ncbi:IclR family transcriptional regulator [Halegenticoccus tardaugens]|uniref:IclR family transcriptional regulator n=1 Tax=Halegenticoccus tardaugens TaxID=2071624 RepID=UPI00100B8AC0|nr:IclR family transcriptional regulator [Halegenticoccus tardaugens]